MRLIVAITGASGVVIGIRFLEVAKEAGIETHLVLSKQAEQIIEIETTYTVEKIKELANYCYDNSDLTAPVASGSYVARDIDAMIICPCSRRWWKITGAMIQARISSFSCGQSLLTEKTTLHLFPYS